MAQLDLRANVVKLTQDLMNISSESFHEAEIADAIERSLKEQAGHLALLRNGNTIVAKTNLGRSERVVIAGHIDTVPANSNFGARIEGEELWGLGATDMKSGLAVALHLAATVQEPNRDITFIFYDAEEVAAIHNGLGILAGAHPEAIAGDFAILMEPTDGVIEGGCQGTLRFEVIARGVRAHSARAWVGKNAIHALKPALDVLHSYEPRTPVIDGLQFHEGLNAVGITGGVAGNVVPDEARLTINYRFAPDLSEQQATEHIKELFAGFEIEITDSAAGALPGLSQPSAAQFVAAAGGEVRAKYGWTDVARFSALGVPAVNFGPGDPALAHHEHERVSTKQIEDVLETMQRWLG